MAVGGEWYRGTDFTGEMGEAHRKNWDQLSSGTTGIGWDGGGERTRPPVKAGKGGRKAGIKRING